jgi:hypothetical protein
MPDEVLVTDMLRKKERAPRSVIANSECSRAMRSRSSWSDEAVMMMSST